LPRTPHRRGSGANVFERRAGRTVAPRRIARWWCAFALLLCTAGVAFAGGAKGSETIAPEGAAGRQLRPSASADRAIAVTAHPLATEAALEMLRRGGSAVDAAIAAQLVLNVVEPQSSGIGGGGFLLFFDPSTEQVHAYDGRETAPLASRADRFLDADGKPLPFFAAVDSGLSVGVPGLLRMLEAAHRAHGNLPWAELFAPAIRIAREGFAISPRLHALIARNVERIRARGETVSRLFLTAEGDPKPVGARLKNPELAATLEAIATHGADAFYHGAIARAIVTRIAQDPRPGLMTENDLAAYRSVVRQAVCATYRARFRICGMPPPSSGGVTVLQTLKLLERFDLAALSPDSPEAIHLVSEAYRLAFADRERYVADPDFVAVPVRGLLDSGYLAERAQLIDRERTLGTPVAGQPPGVTDETVWGRGETVPFPSTTHLSIIDGAGRAVALTSSIEHAFGSLLMVEGFLLNNQLTDFAFRPVDENGWPVANRVAGGKRPRSSMAPTMVFDANTGDLLAVLGSPGGSAIIHYVTQTLIGLIDWRLPLSDAIEQPHFGAQRSATTWVEAGTVLDTPEVAAALTAKGHQVRAREMASGIHAIVRTAPLRDGTPAPLANGLRGGRWLGAADSRREGVAAGF